jgi:hypothetical protein
VTLTSLSDTAGIDYADVSFTSTQLPSDSPNDEDCDKWTLDYGLTFNGSVWQFASVSTVDGTTYASC